MYEATTYFFERVLVPRCGATEVRSYVDEWKGPAWERRLFAAQDTRAAARWVMDEMRGRRAQVPAYTKESQQFAAIVKVAEEAIVNLVFSPAAPSLAVATDEPAVVHAVWIFSAPVR